MAKKGKIEEGGELTPLSLDKVAEVYFAANPSIESIIIAEDGVVFHGDAKGQNSADNYVLGKLGAGGDMVYSKFKKS